MYGLLAISVVSIVALLFKLDMDAVKTGMVALHNEVDIKDLYASTTRFKLLAHLRYGALAVSALAVLLIAAKQLHEWFRLLWRIDFKDDAIYAHVLAFGALMASVTFMYFNPVSLDHVYDLIENFGENVGVLAKLALYALLFLISGSALLLSYHHLIRTAHDDEPQQLRWAWSMDDDCRHWMMLILGMFLIWGPIFAICANIKMDIQDQFIQRVKFLASYSLYSLWIGYGLLVLLNLMIPQRNAGRTLLASLLIIAFPAATLFNNYQNRFLEDRVGGAEQNGHDFGWQFGNYQLRGAESILEELDPREEPLPNPDYPLEMGRRAVFYGGTDPGRFVPTYMIYSADVRPDVFLITQNALADNTFMNITRDLYGNDIWIPSAVDSQMAFQEYIDDVRSGRKPPNANISFENGKVSVSGVGGVMLINGILAKNIFERNKWRHDFLLRKAT